MSHTPGPWTAEPFTRDEAWYPDGGWSAGPALIAQDDQAEDDAKLIAAAPDLLAILRELVEVEAAGTVGGDVEAMSSRYNRAWAAARVLLAKAEGKP